MRKIIRLGDSTSHGGEVVSATSHMIVGGMPVARLGDKCTCPKRGHNNCVIVEGDPNWTVDGIPVALEGHKISCGAVLISSSPNNGREESGGAAMGFSPAAGVIASSIPMPADTSAADDLAYDEQIAFATLDGAPYADVGYKLTLADDSIVSGRTDAQGYTERNVTGKPTAIIKADFYSDSFRCCEKHLEEADTDNLVQSIDVSGVKTNSTAIGSSVVKVTAEDESRPLTAGEIAMSRSIFKDSIDYSKVQVHNSAYAFWQAEQTAVTPSGEMYFKQTDFREDFSAEDDRLKIWFIHEMTHVWQHQLGYNVKLHGLGIALSGGYNGSSAYKYDSSAMDTKISDYNMEQQGDLVAHYFAATVLQLSRYTSKLPFLSRVLSGFIENPKNAALLPK